MLNANENLPDDELTLLKDSARGCVVTYLPHFLSETEADALCERLRTDTPFHAEAPVTFGRPIEVRRRTYSFGEPRVRYRYSGVERIAAPWPAELIPMVERIRARADVLIGVRRS